MSNRYFCIYETTSREISLLIDLPLGVDIQTILTDQQSNAIGITLDEFEIINSTNVQDPNVREHLVNAAGNGFDLKAGGVTDPSNVAFVDPTPSDGQPFYFSWDYNFGGGTGRSNLDTVTLDSWPVVGNPNTQGSRQTNWLRELVDDGNSTTPDGTVYNIESILYQPQTDEVVRFDVSMLSREQMIFNQVTGSNIVIEARMLVQDRVGGFIQYRSHLAPIVSLINGTVQRQTFSDHFIVNLKELEEVFINVQVQARYLGGVTGSSLGVAADNLKIVRQRLQ